MLFRFHNDNTTPKVNWNGKEYDVHRIAGCSDFDIIKIEDSKPFKKEITCFDIELEDNYIEDVYMVPLYGDRRTGVFFDASWDTEKDGNKPLEDYFKGKIFHYNGYMYFYIDIERYVLDNLELEKRMNYMIFIHCENENDKES